MSAVMEDFWSPLQATIEEICFDFDKVCQTRKRVITTQFLVTFILKLVLSKNSQGYKILLNELWETAEFSGLQQQIDNYRHHHQSLIMEMSSGDLKNSYWKNFCGEIRNFKINFKNCLLVVGRSLKNYFVLLAMKILVF